MDKVWVGRNFVTLLVRVHGGASSNGCNSMNPVVRVHGGASCKDVLPRRFRSGASRPGRNSTKVSWWCLTTST